METLSRIWVGGHTATDTTSAPLTCQRSNKTKEKRKQKFGSKHPLVTRDLTVKFDRHYLIITPSPLTRLRQYQSVHTTTTTARPGAGASPGEYYCFEHRHFDQKKEGKNSWKKAPPELGLTRSIIFHFAKKIFSSELHQASWKQQGKLQHSHQAFFVKVTKITICSTEYLVFSNNNNASLNPDQCPLLLSPTLNHILVASKINSFSGGNHENNIFNWGYGKRLPHLGRFCLRFCRQLLDGTKSFCTSHTLWQEQATMAASRGRQFDWKLHKTIADLNLMITFAHTNGKAKFSDQFFRTKFPS